MVIIAIILLGPLAGMLATHVMDPDEFKNADWVQEYSARFWPWNWAFLVLMGLGVGLVGLSDRIEARKGGKS